MNKWRRPYATDGADLRAVAGATVISCFLLMLTYLVVTSPPDRSQVPVLLAVYAFLLFLLAVGIRVARSGIYLGADGIRVRRLLWTRTFRWTEITAIVEESAAFPGFLQDRRAIWIKLADGERVETPVQQISDHGPKANRSVIIEPAEFRAALKTLNEHLAYQRSIQSR